MWAVQAAGWKYIEAIEEDRWELYDLNTDPRERKNLYAEHPEIASDLKRRLDVWLDGRQIESPADTDALTREQRQALEALGYVD